jgi:hypothetical protein
MLGFLLWKLLTLTLGRVGGWWVGGKIEYFLLL